MKIGVIGAGNVGSAIAKRLGAAGHQVMLSFSKDAKELEAAARRYGVSMGTPSEAVRFGDVVALAVQWETAELALQQAGPLAGKIVWDCTIPLTLNRMGLAIGTTTSGGEAIARMATGARVVKAIPPPAQLLLSDDPTVGGKPALALLCSDDSAAKATVAPLVGALPAQVEDFGPLANARFAEPATLVLIHLGFELKRGYRIGLSLLSEGTAKA
jgi:8-hydroxy-5-deazaflavin:NADPH oxidoreductase